MRNGYYHDGEIICSECADSIQWRCHACGRFMRSPEHNAGWCDCRAIGPDGSPGHAIPEHAESCYPQCNEIDSVSDAPQNCGWCDRPIETSLTSDGYAYVMRAIRSFLRVSISARNLISDHWSETSWYYGSPHNAVVRDWVDMIPEYENDRDERVANWFLYLCSKGEMR